jgi:hypothetical protein
MPRLYPSSPEIGSKSAKQISIAAGYCAQEITAKEKLFIYFA